MIDLFSGLGGFGVTAHKMGWETLVMCEIDTDCQVVLKHHFPCAYLHGDIKTLTWAIINEEIEKRLGPRWRDTTRVVVCGGFPCQPWSAAGKRLGKEDARHLWPEMLRVIQECRPDAVVGENVSGIVSWNGGLVFEEVQADLEAQGFEVQAVVVPACAVGAPHRRDRVWFVANATGIRTGRKRENEELDRSGRGDGERGKERSPLWHRNYANGNAWPTANSRHTEPQGRDEIEEGQQHGGWRLSRGFLASLGGAWDASNPAVAGLEGRKWEINEGGRERPSEYSQNDVHNATDSEGCGIQGDWPEGKQVERPPGESRLSGWGDSGGVRNFWSNFPTEWPLRIGDDGLSLRLGRIRLPVSGKRVTESSMNKMTLKMAGNAIVPQVAFEIFKALESTWNNPIAGKI